MNYYNENDRFAAAWLRELIKANQIAPGEVDERSIEDVFPNDLKGFTQCHFFAGIGGWPLAFRLAGWPDNRRVWSGSCPCQPYSQAGEGKGFADERHLWPAYFWLIKQQHPRRIFGEQVAGKAALPWIDLVQSDLEGIGYAFGKKNICAAGVGSPQPRQRLYFVADSECEGLPRSFEDTRISSTAEASHAIGSDEVVRAWRQMATSPTSIPNLDGIPLWLARKLLHGYGNAIVPQVAQAFIEAYLGR